MKTPVKVLIVVAVAVTAVAAVALKQTEPPAQSDTPASTSAVAAQAIPAGETSKANPTTTAKLPKMVDLGAGQCIPCKMMKPILDDLMVNYAGRFTTVFIDVWENREAGKQYGIEVIPTQIFYDAEGKELFRHVGFYGKGEILGKWKELGVDVSGKPSTTAN